MRFFLCVSVLLCTGGFLGQAMASDFAGLVEDFPGSLSRFDAFDLYAELHPPEPSRREKIRALLDKVENGDGPSDVGQFADFLMDLLHASGNIRKDKPLQLDALFQFVKNSKTFFPSTLPFMASLAKRVEELFPRGLPFLSPRKPAVHLRRIQILALLSASFLGTVPHNQRLLLSKRHGIPYEQLHLNKLDMHHRGFLARRAKVASFFNYVEQMRVAMEGCWRQMVQRGELDRAVCSSDCICVEIPPFASGAEGGAFRVASVDEIVGFYFSQPSKTLMQGPPGVVVETPELRVEDLVRQETPLSQFLLDVEGDITKQDGEIQVDFADEYVGGLSMLKIDVAQEELIFHLRPEMLSVMLFTRALRDNEAIVVKGVETFSTYTGYNASFEVGPLVPDVFPPPPLHWSFHGATPIDALGRRDVTVAVIDALRLIRGSNTEYKTQNILREIQKATLGFAGDPFERFCKAEKAAVATGKWGCDIFGGDVELKSLLQWIAASLVGRPLHFNLFHDTSLKSMGPVFAEFQKKFKTVKGLYDAIELAKHTRKEAGGLWKALQKL